MRRRPFLVDLFTKRRQREPHQFKMLPAKGNADNGDTKQQPEEKMSKGDPDAAAKDPNDIEEGGDAAGRTGYIAHLAAKGPEGEQADLKTLQPKWDTDNGDTKDETHHHVFHECNEAAKDEPDEVAE